MVAHLNALSTCLAVNNLFRSRDGENLLFSLQEKLVSEKRAKDKRMGDEDSVSYPYLYS